MNVLTIISLLKNKELWIILIVSIAFGSGYYYGCIHNYMKQKTDNYNNLVKIIRERDKINAKNLELIYKLESEINLKNKNNAIVSQMAANRIDKIESNPLIDKRYLIIRNDALRKYESKGFSE
jgi:hypothetical protein